MFKTTNIISKIEKKGTDLLKGIDEKGSQHLTRMMGVEFKMNIHQPLELFEVWDPVPVPGGFD